MSSNIEDKSAIMAGKKVTLPNDLLQKLSIEYVYNAIVKEDSKLANDITRLRSLISMDMNQYKLLKTELPYIVCGIFNPAIRRKENFVSAQHFIIDIDHISKISQTASSLKERISQNDYAMLIFISPSGDGLKVLFRTTQKIDDASYYSMFYKIFSARFMQEYQLQGAIDTTTHDVSRCCFMSYDPEAVYNPNSTPVDTNLYVNELEINELHKIEKEAKEAASANKLAREALLVDEIANKDLIGIEALQKIKESLQLGRAPRAKKNIIESQQLNDALPGLIIFLAEHSLTVSKSTSINHGKQLQIRTSNLWAEINIFYGQKRGFTVVKTTKTGSNEALANICKEAVERFFDDLVSNIDNLDPFNS